MIFPRIARHTVGVVAVGARKYIDWIAALYRYVSAITHLNEFPQKTYIDTSLLLVGLWHAGSPTNHSSTHGKRMTQVTETKRPWTSLPNSSSRYSCAPLSCSARNSPFSGLQANSTNALMQVYTIRRPFVYSILKSVCRAYCGSEIRSASVVHSLSLLARYTRPF